MSEVEGTSGSWLTPRPTGGRLVAGVCAGLADRSGIDVALVRLAFLILAFAWGIGLVLYLALWLLMPDAGADPGGGSVRARARRNAEGMRSEVRTSGRRLRDAWESASQSDAFTGLGRRGIALVLVGAGALIFLLSIGGLGWLTLPRLIGLAAVLGGIGVLLYHARG